MRPWLLPLGLVGFCLGLPSPAVAQEAPLLLPGPAVPPPWQTDWPRELPVQTAPEAAPIELDVPINRNPLIDVDFLLGLPVAARVGVAVFRHKEQAVLLEAMAGVDLVVPFVAAGARYRFVAWHTKQAELVIKPGVDVYAGVVPFVGFSDATVSPSFYGVGGDVACVFLCNAPRLGFEWGVDLGAIGIMGAGSQALPLASFILGFNF